MKAHTLTSKEFFIRTFVVGHERVYIMITARDPLLRLLSSFQTRSITATVVSGGGRGNSEQSDL